MKCPKCGTNNPDDFLFCEECGEKLEAPKPTCPSCGKTQRKANAKFCPYCGYRFEASPVIGNQNAISGDIKIDSHDAISNTTIYNAVPNEEEVVECHCCGRMLNKASGVIYRCKGCQRYVCADCYDKKTRLCVECLDKTGLKKEKEETHAPELEAFEYEDFGNGKCQIRVLKNKKIRSFTLPSCVESVGTSCFEGSKIVAITLPEGLLELGNRAFANCASLQEINFPSSLKIIGDECFAGCSSLDIVLPSKTNLGKDIMKGTAFEARLKKEQEETLAKEREAEEKRKALEAKRKAEEKALEEARKAQEKALEEERKKQEAVRLALEEKRKAKEAALEARKKPTLAKNKKTVTYGLYPQHVLTDPDSIEAVNSLGKPLGNGWYEYDGEYYAKIIAKPDKSYTGSELLAERVYWFKCESIVWDVLQIDGDKYRLISHDILDVHCFDKSSINYEKSAIRAWINDDFYRLAFMLSDKNVLVTNVDNSAESAENIYKIRYCQDTSDKVFLPSVLDARVYKLKRATATQWAIANGAYVYKEKCYCSYWTRSHDVDLNRFESVYRIDAGGERSVFGPKFDSDFVGIRPCITIVFP